MATILEKATQILNEKNTKLLPEHIKEGITILGIRGSYSVIETEEYQQIVTELEEERTQNESQIQELETLSNDILNGEVSIDESIE